MIEEDSNTQSDDVEEFFDEEFELFITEVKTINVDPTCQSGTGLRFIVSGNN